MSKKGGGASAPALDTLEFNDDDRDLFHLTDTDLKAKAIRNYTLPRLQVMLNEFVQVLNEQLDEDPFSTNTITQTPAFRPSRRIGRVLTDYTHAGVGLTGKRTDQYGGILRRTGRPVVVSPITMGLELQETGLIAHATLGFRPLDLKSSQVLVAPLIEHWDRVASMLLSHGYEIYPLNLAPLGRFKSLRDVLWKRPIGKGFHLTVLGPLHAFPVTNEAVHGAIIELIVLWPIYMAMHEAALGRKDSTEHRMERVNGLLENLERKNVPSAGAVADRPIPRSPTPAQLARASQLADLAISPAPSMRYQVLARDGFRCLACGASSLDGMTLHVDHIVPVSKGGVDIMANLQTLCIKCNLGKSNRDQTDVRKTLKPGAVPT